MYLCIDRIDPGEFRHPVEIISVEQKVNDDFTTYEEENILLRTRAKVVNVSGKESILANKRNVTNVKRFYIRYKNIDISTDCKIQYNKKTYNITYISDVEEKHKYFEIVGELVE